MSMTNMELKFIKSLQTKKGRKESGRFIAEGIRLLEEALRRKFYPEKIYFTNNNLSERGEKLIGGFKRVKINLENITSAQLQAISETKAPQGILAVFRTPAKKLVELYWPKHRKLLLCENISDPGNLGTLIRSAAAFDFDMVILSGDSAEPFSPKVVRSSAGGIFTPVIVKGDIDTILAFVAAEKILLVAGDLKGKPGKLPSNYMKRKIMLAVGSEGEGLSADVLRKAVVRLRIEHSRKVESLNAAIAGSILMSRLYK